MAATGGLPRYAVLKCISNNRYVRCTTDGLIRVDGDDVLSPNCKLELERAETAGKDLINIRSCYNNKYWAKEGPNSTCLKAKAAKPDEDQSNWACTLFTHHFQARTKQLKLNSPGENGQMLCCEGGSLFVGGKGGGTMAEFTVTDWESLLILPKHVTFKGDNGKYLAAQWIEEHQYHKFDSTDLGDPRVEYEIFPTGDGSVRIKSKYFNRFWRRSPNWIWADSSNNNNNNKDTLFVPVKVEKNSTVIALRNLGNNNFCKRFTTEGKESCLNAAISSITREARMVMEEVVLSREISNVKYRLGDARIYHENILTMVTREATNNNSVPETHALRLSYKHTRTKSWERNVTTSLSVSTTIEAGVPFIVDGEVQITATIEGSFKWGAKEESSEEVESTDTVTVPPNTRVKASVLATKGKCDVPFSYTVRDVLTDGRVVTYDMDDGLYTGINCYNFRTETTKYGL